MDLLGGGQKPKPENVKVTLPISMFAPPGTGSASSMPGSTATSGSAGGLDALKAMLQR